MLGLIWILTGWHLDGIEKIQHPKSKIWHNNKVWRNNKSNIENPNANENTLFRKYVRPGPLADSHEIKGFL